MKSILVVVGAVLTGVALGWWLKPVPVAAPIEPTPAKPSHKVAQVQVGQADVKGLNQRIAQLEAELAAATNHTEEVETKAAETPPPPAPRDWAASFKERMDEMQRNNPKEYNRITNRMARFKTQMQERTLRKLQFLASMSTKGMSAQQKENHEKLQDMIAQMAELGAKLDPTRDDVPMAERMAAGAQMHEMMRSVHEVAESERKTLLDQTAKVLGCDPEEFGDTVKGIFEATESWPGPHGFGGGHGGRHGGGRGGKR